MPEIGPKDCPVRLITLIFIVMTGWGVPVTAQAFADSREDIIRLLARMDEFVPVERDFRSLGFEGENLKLAMEQYRRVFGDRDIAEFVADRLIAAKEGSLTSAMAAGGLLGPLIERGIGHLPTSDLAYFYKVENAVFNALPERECGLAVKQRLSDRRLADATARAAARLNSPALKEYYRIQYKAARLGLTREAVSLSAAQTERIEGKIGEAIFARSGDPRTLDMIRIFENPGRASNRDACKAARSIMEVVMTMQGRDLRDALIYFSAP